MADTITELTNHYKMWTEDNEKRSTRTRGWNDITDAYYGILPEDWPYITRITDPRIHTSLLEKNARLVNKKLRGTLVPRETVADQIKAKINNAILNYQWDSANDGGSMLTKTSICDMDTRLYGSKFALVEWREEKDDDGNITFAGNEFIPLDIRNCGIDPNSSHIRDARWFQLRTWETLEDLEKSDIFKNVDKLKRIVKEKLETSNSSAKNTEYISRGKTLRSLEDRTGEDLAFPVVKIVTEFREDKWITFAPDHKLILRETDNPYDHGKIPIAQLKYYPLQDDPLGESEIEPALPLWKAIQATVCGYLDESFLKMRPPLKIIENAARVETIQYGPEAQWLVTRQDAVEEMRSSGDALAYFQTTYQALVAAFNVAMGDMSQGISNFGPFQEGEKTATEIRATERQRNTRDQKNQNDLGEFLKDVMMMWLANNQQFLFSDADKEEHIIRIVGRSSYKEFEEAGLADMEVPPEAMQMIQDIIMESPDMGDMEIQTLMDAAKMPKHPVAENPDEKDPTKLIVKPKMRKTENGEAELSVVPEDLEGTYDFIPDVRSMTMGSGEQVSQARRQAIEILTTNEVVLQLLQQEGVRPDVRELLISEFEGLGLNDAERYFKQINDEQQGQAQETNEEMAGPGEPIQKPRVPNVPEANPQGGLSQQVATP